MATPYWALKFLLHVIIFGIYAFTLTYDTYYLAVHPGRNSYGGRFKFLTFWNELIQTAFFAYSIINDIFGSNTPPPTKGKQKPVRSSLQKVRDLISASIVFPIGAFVVIMFWAIYFYDRELIYPKALEEVIPSWLNHVWHTSVIFFVLIEKFVVYHHYPDRIEGLTVAALFILSYVAWVFWVAYKADFWIYPLLAVLNWPFRIVFILSSAAFVIVLYLIGEFITNSVWASSRIEVQSKTKKIR